MARFLIRDASGRALNVIEWDGEADLNLPAGHSVRPDDGTPVLEAVPESVTNYQARSALIAVDLFVKTDGMLRASGDLEAIQAWDYANNFYRASPFIAKMQAALTLSDDQVDDLFRQAARVQ